MTIFHEFFFNTTSSASIKLINTSIKYDSPSIKKYKIKNRINYANTEWPIPYTSGDLQYNLCFNAIDKNLNLSLFQNNQYIFHLKLQFEWDPITTIFFWLNWHKLLTVLKKILIHYFHHARYSLRYIFFCVTSIVIWKVRRIYPKIE